MQEQKVGNTEQELTRADEGQEFLPLTRGRCPSRRIASGGGASRALSFTLR